MGIADRIKKSLGLGKRNFKYLDKLINSGSKEIVLDSDIVSDANDRSKYASGIEIKTDNLIIDGNGHTIDAYKLRIFQIVGKKVTFKNITFKNGYVDSGGAIFCFSSEIRIENCIFENNAAKRYGGAIYNDGGEITLHKTVFIENTYASEVIYNRSGKMNIKDCEISNNSGSYCIIDNGGFLNIENTVFKNNKSDFLMVNSKESNLSIIYSKLISNRLRKHLIFNNGGISLLKDTILENSLATSQYNVFNEGHLTFNDIEINDINNWLINKGELYIKFSKEEYSFEENEDNTVNVVDSSKKVKYVVENYGSIETNSIPKEEGNDDFTYLDKVIHESGEKEITLHSNISLKNYELEFFEGGIELDIDDMVINGNGHSIDGAGKSRIFIVSGKNITLKDIILKNGNVEKSYYSISNNDGGALRNARTGDLTLDSCTFSNNRSKNLGGAISNQGMMTMIGNTLEENRSERGGAISNQGTVTMQKSMLLSNSSKYGGAINNLATMSIQATNIKKNTSWSGGAVYNQGTITFKGSRITDNDSRSDGGGICNKGEIEMDGIVLKQNKSGSSGGALYSESQNANGKITIIDCEIANNESESGGGAIYASNEDITIKASIFNGNRASYGGSITNWKNMVLDNCRLIKNKANNGGAIDNNGHVEINDSIINDNLAEKEGGAIKNKGNIEINGSFINNNVGEKVGGAISNLCEMLIDNSEINGNFSRKGGSIFNDKKGKLEVRNSKLNNNTIYLSEGKDKLVDKLTDDGVIIMSGKIPSTWYPGAICSLSSKKHLKIIDCECEDMKLV